MSTRLVKDASEAVLGWAAHKLGTVFRQPCIAFGVLNREGKLVGAVIYNDFDARNIEMTMVGSFKPGIVKAGFSYAFNELGCRRISVTIPSRNKDMIAKALRWGWAVEGLKRDYYDNDHAIILGMLRDECRFLKD